MVVSTIWGNPNGRHFVSSKTKQKIMKVINFFSVGRRDLHNVLNFRYQHNKQITHFRYQAQQQQLTQKERSLSSPTPSLAKVEINNCN